MDTLESRELRVFGEIRCSLWHPLQRCQPVSSCSDYFFSILVNFQYIIRSAEEGVAITVFFDEEATDEQIQKIGEELKARDDVSEVKYISAEQAWEDFQKDYFGDNLELAEGFKDDNPLANSDNYEVYMKTTDNSQDLIARSKSLLLRSRIWLSLHRVWMEC